MLVPPLSKSRHSPLVKRRQFLSVPLLRTQAPSSEGFALMMHSTSVLIFELKLVLVPYKEARDLHLVLVTKEVLSPIKQHPN